MATEPDAASAERLKRTAALTRTAPAEAFSEAAVQQQMNGDARAPATMPDPSAGTSPMLERPSLSEQLRRHGLSMPGPQRPRFEVERVLGIGATGRVYAVRDHNLERPVAVKFLAPEGRVAPEDVRHFIQEAQITASLEHPNVLPVHELDVNDAGQVYFTMKQIDGRSLGAALEQSTLRQRAAPIRDLNAIVSVFIGVCQALAYAHDRGVVHQDIKPDNIMLGDYGEVLLVDWGSAARLRAGETPRIYGTPLYMSPEQARAERVDERSDIYCLGATLFHTLLLRHPCWSDDPERFWLMKRSGEILAPTPQERLAVPPALLDVALKALAPDPAARYRSAAEMLTDLRSCQAGLAVSAHRDSLLELLARWHRRHARAIWSTVAATALITALVGTIYGERLKEMATWGKPLIDERFDDDSWKARWKPLDGEFAASDGWLVTTHKFESKLVCTRRFEGATAIEYDAEILPGARPCDLSVTWSRDAKFSADGARVEKLDDEYRFQIGAFDGAYTAITKTEGNQNLAFDDFHPVPGQRYHVRAEIVDNRLALWIDGKLRCEWLDPIPFTGGYVALFGFYPGKAFDNLRIYQRGVPQKVPATAIGDEFAREELWDQAVRQYLRVANSHPGSELEREAIYRAGLCRYRHQEWDAAFKLWEPLRGTDRDELVRLHDLERAIDLGEHDRALAELEALYREASPPTRRRIAMAWARAIDRLRQQKKNELVARYLTVHDRVLTQERTVDINAATALLFLSRPQEVLDRYPSQRLQCCFALQQLGRQDEIAEHYADQGRQHALALFLTGRSSEIDAEYHRELYAMGLVKRGRLEEAVAGYRDQVDAYACALLALGRLDEIPTLLPGSSGHEEWARGRALMLAGRADELQTNDASLAMLALLARGEAEQVVAAPAASNLMKTWARHLLGMRAWISGDHDAARSWFALKPGMGDISQERVYFLHRFVVPFLTGLDTRDFAELDANCADVIAHKRYNLEQAPWYQAQYLTGRIDDAGFLAAEHHLYFDATLLVMRALRHECARESAAALADYRAYLALPLWRRGIEVDPALNTFMEWRAAELGKN